MTFAFIIKGDFDPEKDRAAIHGGDVQVIGVSAVHLDPREPKRSSRSPGIRSRWDM